MDLRIRQVTSIGEVDATIIGKTRTHDKAATFEVRASEIASSRPGDQLTVGTATFVIQGEPERRDPDRLVWTLVRRRIQARTLGCL